jgi:hypothetical protein
MLEYSEKRDFPRMAVECPAQFRLEGSDQVDGAIVKDLSGGGVLLWVDQQVEPGSQLSIVIMPGKHITPPLHAKLEVIRCFPLEEEEGSYAAACSIVQLLDEKEVGASFP